MPALPANCYRTRHGYLFRVVVPESLRPAIGKREIKKSLGKDYREAASQARLLGLQVDSQFVELRERLAREQQTMSTFDAYVATPPQQRRLKPITRVTPELVAGLKSLWLANLEADLDWRRQGLDDQDYDELQANIAEVKQVVAKALSRGQPEPFIPVVRGLLIGRGYELAVSTDEERQLVLDLLPAIQHGYDVLEQRQAGRLVEPVLPDAPPLRAAWEPTLTPPTGLTWYALLDHWKQDRPRPARTQAEVETYVKAISAFLPQATPATLTRAQVTEWLRNERETRGNAAKTLEKKGTLLGALFSVAVKDELLEKNPFSNFDYSRFAAKEGMEDPDEREPFTLDQLKRVFSATEGVFSVTSGVGGGGYHARVWGPSIGLLSGARLDEIGRLTVADVLMDPVPHFVIRRGKNQSSVREVPVHPKLINLGFLDYVEAIRSAGHLSLWPQLKTRSKKANNSEMLGKWFNRFIHETLGLPSTVVFHSLRHNFKDLCRDALIPRDLHHALTGHSKGAGSDKKNVGDEYGKGFSLEVKLAQMRKIKLPFALPKPKAYKAAVKLSAATASSARL